MTDQEQAKAVETALSGFENFPSRVTLVDTGQRRYPLSGEIYMWRRRNGTIAGPCFCEDPDNGSWAHPGDQYAIFTVATLTDRQMADAVEGALGDEREFTFDVHMQVNALDLKAAYRKLWTDLDLLENHWQHVVGIATEGAYDSEHGHFTDDQLQDAARAYYNDKDELETPGSGG